MCPSTPASQLLIQNKKIAIMSDIEDPSNPKFNPIQEVSDQEDPIFKKIDLSSKEIKQVPLIHKHLLQPILGDDPISVQKS